MRNIGPFAYRANWVSRVGAAMSRKMWARLAAEIVIAELSG
jgi:hypothetical protein